MSQSNAQVRPSQFGTVLERRRQPRVYLPVSVCVSRSKSACDSHFAYMRDANIRGAFFYCDMEVTVGETLFVQLASVEARAKFAVNCEARVVRVEKPAAHGNSGIAVEFYRFEVEDPASAREPLTSRLPNLGIDNFQRMFTQRQELEKCAFRIQGAA